MIQICVFFGSQATKHVENLKKEIMSMAIQNRQDMIIPECALKPERVHQMIKKMEDAATQLKSEAKKGSKKA